MPLGHLCSRRLFWPRDATILLYFSLIVIPFVEFARLRSIFAAEETGLILFLSEHPISLSHRPFAEENKKVIGREGAIPPLLLLLRSNVEKIQRNAAVTLKNLTSQNGSSFAQFSIRSFCYL